MLKPNSLTPFEIQIIDDLWEDYMYNVLLIVILVKATLNQPKLSNTALNTLNNN